MLAGVSLSGNGGARCAVLRTYKHRQARHSFKTCCRVPPGYAPVCPRPTQRHLPADSWCLAANRDTVSVCSRSKDESKHGGLADAPPGLPGMDHNLVENSVRGSSGEDISACRMPQWVMCTYVLSVCLKFLLRFCLSSKSLSLSPCRL